MALSNVRKSGRIKARKTSSLLLEDFEYDEAKFGLDEINIENGAKLDANVSSDISDLLHSHSKEVGNSDGHVPFLGDMNELEEDGGGVCDDGREVVVCPVCQKHLSTDEELESHFEEHKTHNGDWQLLSCDDCGKMFYEADTFRRHLKSHTGERPFECGQCEKNFVDSCSLKRHMKSHEDDRPFSCEICHKTFRDAGSIGRHMLTHTERPRSFQCSMCDKNFTDKSGLKRHERTHTGIRPYACGVCQKTFVDSGSFRRHQKIHVGVKNHHCPVCQKSFMEKQSLVRHQKTVCKFYPDSEPGYNQEDGGQIPGNWADLTSNADPDTEVKGLEYSSDEVSNSSINGRVSTPLQSFPEGKVTDVDFASNLEKSSSKGPSLSSLIQKDPKLYDSISEIVDSIDSYEKMLDLCGDRGQKEIDAALKRDSIPMPDNLLCFECGELLIDGSNFQSEGKSFFPTMTNAFKCLNCEEEEEDDYGEPPVLMPQYGDGGGESTDAIAMDGGHLGGDAVVMDGNHPERDSIAGVDSHQILIGGDDLSMENSHEPLEQFPEYMKQKHGVYFLEDSGYPNQLSALNEEDPSGIGSSANSITTDSERSNSNPPMINDLGLHQHDSNDLEEGSSSRAVNVASAHPANNSSDWSPGSCDLDPKPDYEADDPSIPSVFPCHLCTKVFASSSFLAQHLDLHRKSPFKCMVCSKTFTSGPALTRHMRLHTGEKPYTCPVCLKQFRDPSNFCKHKKNCAGAMLSTNPPLTSVSIPDDDAAIHVGSNSMAFVKEEVIPEDEKVAAFDPDLGDNCHEKTEETESGNEFPVMAVMPSLDDDLMDEPVDDEGKEEVENNDEKGEGKTETNYIPCDICQKMCDNEQHLEMHMNYHTGNPDVTCIECGKSFSEVFGLKRHMRTHLGIRPFTCEYCGRGYCDNWSLKKHKSKGCMRAELRVPADLLHPCQECPKVFCDQDNLEEHMKTHKGLLRFQCDVCQKGFSEAFNLKKHRRLHMAICPGCGQEFRDMTSLATHQASECTAVTPVKEEATDAGTSGKAFACEVCGRMYSTRAYLDRHKKIHSELKPHVCEICNKRFSEAFKLRRHTRSAHSDSKPFACQDCGKSFVEEASLRRHAVSSSCALSKVLGEPVGAETCVCVVCDKVFQKNYMLVRHMTVHSQDRPFSCDMCGKSYKDTSSLKRHQTIHQGVKAQVCPVCGKDFYFSDSLKRHMSGRCGKGRRGKAMPPRKAKCQSYAHFDISDTVLDNNDNNNIGQSRGASSPWNDSLDTSPHLRNLHTWPYCSPLVTPSSRSFRCRPTAATRGQRLTNWSCVSKGHCWLCDVKMASRHDLMVHRRIHLHKKRFSCRKCFLRFHSKVYLKAHCVSSHHGSGLAVHSNSGQTRASHSISGQTMAAAKASLRRKIEFVEVDDLDTVSNDLDGDMKRPRRSVPRAQWSWISQI